jgi:hypothetical protein
LGAIFKGKNDMKIFLLFAAIACSLNANAAQTKNDKCVSVKNTILYFAHNEVAPTGVQQAGIAAAITAMLAAYQAAQCPAISADEALLITHDVVNGF